GGIWPDEWKQRWGSQRLSGYILNWILGVIFIYGATFGIGALIFTSWATGICLILAAAIAGYWGVRRALATP
ncbi:MAG: hypothetical protein ABIE92_11645, partial [bacterium]